MGKGHVTFFYDKILYLITRWHQIRHRLECMGYNLSDSYADYVTTLASVMQNSLWYNDYEPTQTDMEINRARIRDRLTS